MIDHPHHIPVGHGRWRFELEPRWPLPKMAAARRGSRIRVFPSFSNVAVFLYDPPVIDAKIAEFHAPDRDKVGREAGSGDALPMAYR